VTRTGRGSVVPPRRVVYRRPGIRARLKTASSTPAGIKYTGGVLDPEVGMDVPAISDLCLVGKNGSARKVQVVHHALPDSADSPNRRFAGTLCDGSFPDKDELVRTPVCEPRRIVGADEGGG
jgi:hypothetical protein